MSVDGYRTLRDFRRATAHVDLVDSEPREEPDRSAWRLLPSEQVWWYGRPVPGVQSGRRWVLGPLFLLTVAAIFGSFAGVVALAGLSGAARLGAFALFLGCGSGLAWLAPRWIHDPCEYLVTDRRILLRWGRFRRSMDRRAVDYARIRWHRQHPGVGHLELVRAVPFGPLARSQRLMLLNVRGPDQVWATIRGATASGAAGAGDTPLTERFDEGERLIWGSHPEGWLVGWRNAGIAAIGLAVLAVGVRYAARVGSVLLLLEEQGLGKTSSTFLLFFVGVALTFCLVAGVGAGLLWFGTIRARRMGHDTEYVVTNRRLLIRRGRVELSVDLDSIVDVAQTPTWGRLHHLFLVLDAPGSRALAVSGALRTVIPARDTVAPILYDLRDVEGFRRAVFGRGSRPGEPPVRDAA